MPEWVPLVEGGRIIARYLSGRTGDNFTVQILQRAYGILLGSLREGTINSSGLPSGWLHKRQRRPLIPRDWQTLEPMIEDCGLRPHGSPRHGRVDWIEDIEVDAESVRQVALVNDLTSPVGEIHAVDPQATLNIADEEITQAIRGFLEKHIGPLPGVDDCRPEIETLVGKGRLDRNRFRRLFATQTGHRGRGRPRLGQEK